MNPSVIFEARSPGVRGMSEPNFLKIVVQAWNRDVPVTPPFSKLSLPSYRRIIRNERSLAHFDNAGASALLWSLYRNAREIPC